MASGCKGPEDRLAGVRQREEAASILLRKAQQLRLKGTVSRWVGEWVCGLRSRASHGDRGGGRRLCVEVVPCLCTHMDTRTQDATHSVYSGTKSSLSISRLERVHVHVPAVCTCSYSVYLATASSSYYSLFLCCDCCGSEMWYSSCYR